MNDISIVPEDKYTQAWNLNVRICQSAQMAQQNLWEVCKGLKEMRDSKLYKKLGYQNFEDYTEKSVGIKHSQAYKMISVAEKLPEESFHPGGKIGLSKLYLLSTLSESERTEITENNDIAEMTKRELEQKISEIKDRDKTIESLRQKNTELTADNTEAHDTIECLEKQIEELEARPVEIAVEESHEVENMRKAMVKMNSDHEKALTEIQESNFKDIRRMNDEHNAEIKKITAEHSAAMNKLSAEFEEKLAEAKNAAPAEAAPVADTKEIFKAYYANSLDSVNRLFTFVEKNADKLYTDKLIGLANMILEKTKNIKED